VLSHFLQNQSYEGIYSPNKGNTLESQ